LAGNIKIDSGPVFRRIDKWGQIGATALDPQSVNESSSLSVLAATTLNS
jgi:hypothetical protein